MAWRLDSRANTVLQVHVKIFYAYLGIMCEHWYISNIRERATCGRRDTRGGQEKATWSCSEVCASSLLSQPTHSADTIVETPNAMRMSGSLFKETLSSGARNQKQHPIFYTTTKRGKTACFEHKHIHLIIWVWRWVEISHSELGVKMIKKLCDRTYAQSSLAKIQSVQEKKPACWVLKPTLSRLT